MSRYYSYLNSTKEILAFYRGQEPLASFLKKYFARNKKFGSTDRKEISNLCYCYFRLGKALLSMPDEQRILAGLFLCSPGSQPLLEELKPEWNTKSGLSVAEKISLLGDQLSSVFPWKDALSAGMEYEKFCSSFFVQPDLFLRIRPGRAESVLFKLNEIGVPYSFLSPFTVRLPNSFKADQYFEPDREVVVQDYNSQQISRFIPVRRNRSGRVWDCCAGSGGKSIMTHDLDPGINLTVSDIRPSILVNIKKRLARAGIRNYQSFAADLTQSAFPAKPLPFELIIADVPCTGSGTWGRTPEQLFYFDPEKIGRYAAKQKQITSAVVPHLEPGGHLLYITCSVFKAENEDVVSFLTDQFSLQPVKMELFKGYAGKADTLFAALLCLPEQ